MVTSTSNSQKIQKLLAEVEEKLSAAKALADETGESFMFFDRQYIPKTIVNGHWYGEGEDEEDEDEWNSSNC